MKKIYRTVQGIKSMPLRAAAILTNCILICCGLVTGVIMLRIAAQGTQAPPFALLEKADLLNRIAPAVLMYGVVRSLNASVEQKK